MSFNRKCRQKGDFPFPVSLNGGKAVAAILCLLVLHPAGRAQKQVGIVQQTWLGYINQVRFSKRWGLDTDMHLRTKNNFYKELSQHVFRTGLSYYFTDNIKATAGYAYFHNHPDEGHKNVAQPEHRWWQQIQWDNNYPKIRLRQRMRLEERFRRKIKNDDALMDGYHFNYRIRYQILFFIPLSSKAFAPKTLSAFAGNEIMWNLGKQIVYNTFDQNRLLSGLNYHINPHQNLQFGYMHVFQQLSSGNKYRSVHAARIYYQHAIEVRRKVKG